MTERLQRHCEVLTHGPKEKPPSPSPLVQTASSSSSSSSTGKAAAAAPPGRPLAAPVAVVTNNSKPADRLHACRVLVELITSPELMYVFFFWWSWLWMTDCPITHHAPCIMHTRTGPPRTLPCAST